MKTPLANLLLLFYGLCLCHAQGFVNLNFERGISASNTIPNWTAYMNGTPTFVYYNDFAISGASISIMDTNSHFFSAPIQGKYYALFTSDNVPGRGASISLGQIGQVPISAQSLTFWGYIGGMQISFNGQPLSFTTLGTAPNYSIYGADISMFAGQTGELRFTVPPYIPGGIGGYLDDIQFSTSLVPEPSQLALAALGTLLLGSRRWQKWVPRRL